MRSHHLRRRGGVGQDGHQFGDDPPPLGPLDLQPLVPVLPLGPGDQEPGQCPTRGDQRAQAEPERQRAGLGIVCSGRRRGLRRRGLAESVALSVGEEALGLAGGLRLGLGRFRRLSLGRLGGLGLGGLRGSGSDSVASGSEGGIDVAFWDSVRLGVADSSGASDVGSSDVGSGVGSSGGRVGVAVLVGVGVPGSSVGEGASVGSVTLGVGRSSEIDGRAVGRVTSPSEPPGQRR